MIVIAIPLMLLKADLRKVFRDSGSIMIPLCIAAVGVILGAIIGFYLFPLGDIGPKVAGVYTAGFIGGSMNFVAVSEAVGMTSDEFSAAISASSIVSVLALIMLVALPSFKILTYFIPSKIMEESPAESEDEAESSPMESEFKLTHITGALALSLSICVAAKLLANTLELSQYNILFVTIITVAIANIFPKQLHKLKGEVNLGMLFMYMFFVMVGLHTNMSVFLEHALVLFFYGLFIIVVQFIAVLGMAKIFKIDLAEALTGAGAAIVGPAVTAAVVSSKGWSNMVTPAIMTGIFGYVVANFIGVALTAFLSP